MPLFWICLAFIIGIAAAPFVLFSYQIIGSVFILALLIAYAEKRVARYQSHPLLHNPLFKIPTAMLLAAGLFGISLYRASLPEFQNENIYHFAGNSNATLIGLVSSDPDITSRYTSATITCHTVTIDGESYHVQGKTHVILPQGFQIRYGDIVEVNGEIKSTFSEDDLPFTSRDGREKIFTKIEYPDVKIISTNKGNPILSALYRTRERANGVIFDMMPFPESAVLSGILLGLETSIPAYLWNGYRASGIAHIIVISGFNISVITHLIFRVFSRSKRRGIALPSTIGIVILYTILVGADTPVVRAAIMACIGLPAARIGRRPISIHSLILAAAFMLVFNPFLLWDISFQLSFLATLALQVMVDPIIRWITGFLDNDEEEVSSGHAALELVITTLCASIAVFPILFHLTGTLSLVSIPANIIVGPMQPLIMTAGGISVLIGLVSPILSRLLGVIVWPLIAFCNQIALRLSVHPSSTVYLPGWIYYVSLILVIFLLVFFSVLQIISLSKPMPDTY
jgi:competence protein ComEC